MKTEPHAGGGLSLSAWIWSIQRRVGLWQPLPAARQQDALASLGSNDGNAMTERQAWTCPQARHTSDVCETQQVRGQMLT